MAAVKKTMIEVMPYSVYDAGKEAKIVVLHQITLGDILIATLLLALITFVVLKVIVDKAIER